MSNDWLRFRDTRWESAGGTRVAIKNLTIDHLVNILNWVRARPDQYPTQIYEMMVEEAAYRKLLQFADGKPMPVQDEEGTWSLQEPSGKNIEPARKSDYSTVVDNAS